MGEHPYPLQVHVAARCFQELVRAGLRPTARWIPEDASIAVEAGDHRTYSLLVSIEANPRDSGWSLVWMEGRNPVARLGPIGTLAHCLTFPCLWWGDLCAPALLRPVWCAMVPVNPTECREQIDDCDGERPDRCSDDPTPRCRPLFS